MTLTDFHYLLKMIGGKIWTENTKFRQSISPSIRLAATLRFLASGDSFTSLMYTCRISKQAISQFVPEVYEAIISALQKFMKMPKSTCEWVYIAENSSARWNFPNCLGSIDGKHIQTVSPAHSGIMFLNYKGFFSIVLLAVARANYVIYAGVGCQGQISDDRVFSHTMLYEKIHKGKLGIPEPKVLPGRTKPIHYVFVADDAFALSKNIIA